MVKIQPILCSSVASIYLIKTLAKLGVIIKIKEIRDQRPEDTESPHYRTTGRRCQRNSKNGIKEEEKEMTFQRTGPCWPSYRQNDAGLANIGTTGSILIVCNN